VRAGAGRVWTPVAILRLVPGSRSGRAGQCAGGTGIWGMGIEVGVWYRGEKFM